MYTNTIGQASNRIIGITTHAMLWEDIAKLPATALRLTPHHCSNPACLHDYASMISALNYCNADEI